MKFRHLLPLLLLACASCSSKPVDPTVRLSAQDARDCLADGGEIQIAYLAESCLLATKDAGTPCSDSNQCEGRCLAPDETPAGTAVIGACSVKSGDTGCANVVVAGTATGSICP